MTEFKTWEIFLADKRYNELVNELDGYLNETGRMLQKGYREDVVHNKMKEKVFNMQLKFKELTTKLIEETKEKIKNIEQSNKVVKFDNPQDELLKRQDLVAKIELIDSNELVNFIEHLDPDDTGVYELSIYQKAIEERLNEVQQRQVESVFYEIKKKVLNPYSDNPEHEKALFNLNVLESCGMETNGQPIAEDAEGVSYFRNIQDEYNKVVARYS